MRRMFALEATVFRKYIRQLLLSVLFVSFFLIMGMESIIGLPTMTSIMLMLTIVSSSAGYDEQNNWQAYRLLMPLRRRDVVAGRYAFVLVTALSILMLLIVVCLGVSALGRVVALPGILNDIVLKSADDLLEFAASTVAGICLGVTFASLSLPVFFKFGQTKATQWLPVAMICIVILPFFAFSSYADALAVWLLPVLEFAGNPLGLAIVMCASLGIVAAFYIVSAFASIRLYEERDL